MSYQGIYINLDRSTKRRAEMESELARNNLSDRYTRLSAVEGNALNLRSPLENTNEIGCFLSHIAALRQSMQVPQHLHVIEDDVLIARCTGATLDWAITSGMIDHYDILYTDIAIPLSNDVYRDFKSLFDQAVTHNADGGIASVKFQALQLQNVDFLAASSYLINKNSFAKLMALYEAELAEGLRVPVDVFFRNYAHIGGLKIGCLFPFVTSARVEETLTSTIRRNADATRRFTAANIGRYSFYIDCDWNECARLMDAYIQAPPASDRHTELLTRLLTFSLLTK